MNQNDPINELRKRIRHAGRQFRHNNDNSQSIFHPACGFVYGYDMHEVEAALDAFEAQLASEYRSSECSREVKVTRIFG